MKSSLLLSLLLLLFWFTKNYSLLGWINKKLSYLRLIQTFISLPLKFKLQRLYHITRHNFFISIKNEIFLEKLEKTFYLNSFELQSYRPTKCFILGLSWPHQMQLVLIFFCFIEERNSITWKSKWFKVKLPWVFQHLIVLTFT